MAFSIANLCKVASVATGIHETTAVDNGFGSTTNLTQRVCNVWVYAENETVANIVTATFAAAGSTTGSGILNDGDIVFIVGSNTVQGYWVSNAGTGALTAFGS